MAQLLHGRGERRVCVCECDLVLDQQIELWKFGERGAVCRLQCVDQLFVLHSDWYVGLYPLTLMKGSLLTSYFRHYRLLFKLGFRAQNLWIY